MLSIVPSSPISPCGPMAVWGLVLGSFDSPNCKQLVAGRILAVWVKGSAGALPHGPFAPLGRFK